MDRVIEDNEEDSGVKAQDTLAEVREHLKTSVGEEHSDRVFLITVRDRKFPDLLQPEFEALLRLVVKDVATARNINCSDRAINAEASASSQFLSHQEAHGSWETLGGCF